MLAGNLSACPKCWEKECSCNKVTTTRDRRLQLTFIAYNHIDVTCWNCYTTFGVREKEYIKCPNCGSE